jgi:threonine dehydrogenase-like Zn-dependent dehydrogenase
MRQLTFLAPGRLEWTDAPDPSVHDDHGALIRPLAVARCDLDARMVADGLFPGPYPLGHEVAGEVVAVGSAVRRHHRGDRVLVPPQPSGDAGRRAAFRGLPYPRASRCRIRIWRGRGGHGRGRRPARRPHADHLLIPPPRPIAAEVLCTLPDNVGPTGRRPPLAAPARCRRTVVGGAAVSIACMRSPSPARWRRERPRPRLRRAALPGG